MCLLALMVWLMGCASPKNVALQACEAVALLSPDPASEAVLRPLVNATELAALGNWKPTLGSELVDASTLQTIRSQSTCRIESMEEKKGVWTIELVRTQPTVLSDGQLGEPQDRAMTWTATDDGGLKLDIGLAHSAEVRTKIEAAAAKGNQRKVAALWRALNDRFPDPLIAVDIDRADYAHALSFLQSHIEAKLTSVDASDEDREPDRVVATVRNKAKRVATKVQVKFEFDLERDEGDEGEVERFAVIKTIGPLKPGDEVEVKASIPPGAGDQVSVSIEGVSMPWAK